MKGYLYVIGFTLLTAFCWGVYGPIVQTGQFALGEGLMPVRWRAFICVGLAYFIIAVIVPSVWLQLFGEKGNWTSTGFVWSFVAGVAGALGALGIVLAFSNGGNPLYVMPLVFGIAPVVNTFTTMYLLCTFKEIGPAFLAGLILVIAGAVVVLVFKPSEDRPKLQDLKEEDGKISFKLTKKEGGETTVTDIVSLTPDELKAKDKAAFLAYQASKRPAVTLFGWLKIILSIALTGVCWGAYGPMLHKGQTAMNGSRLRPFLCVGLAYLGVAVIIPFALLGWLEPTASFNFSGTVWSLCGGAVGAVGAIGIIMAFNFGGKPIFVMPIVFGLAPVINSFYEIIGKGLLGKLSEDPTRATLFYAGLLLVVAGAVTVLLFAPKAKPHGPAPAK